MPEGNETFYGPWTVEVVQKVAAFSQRFRIQGSDASDGVYPGTPGMVLPLVTGARWTLAMEWSDDVGSGWQPSGIRKRADYSALEGLVVTLGADDNLVERRDHDFDDLVIVCRSRDPAVNPIPLDGPPLSFEVPGGGKPYPDPCKPPDPGQHDPCKPPPHDPCKPPPAGPCGPRQQGRGK